MKALELNCGEVRTAYWRMGDPNGQTLVLLHGMQGNHDGLDRLTRALSDFDLVVPDLPSHGQSGDYAGRHSFDYYADWLAEFVTGLELNQPLIVGHSMGAMIAMVSAAKNPGLYGALSLIVPVPTNRSLVSHTADLAYRAIGYLPQRLQKLALGNPMMSVLACWFYLVSPDRSAWRRQYQIERGECRVLRPRMSIELNRDFHRLNFSDYPARVDLPVQVLAANHDRMTNLPDQQRFATGFRQLDWHVLTGTGHFVHVEQPAELARHIRRFAKNHPSPHNRVHEHSGY